MHNRLPFRKISIIGLGYIGLPTAAMFASRKIEVIGVDVNPSVVDCINKGQIHIVEPDLDIAVQTTVSQGYLRATQKPEPAEAFLIAVPTPFKGDNHEPDLSYIEAASKAIAPVLKSGNLIVLESTSPVGATIAMANWLAEARPDLSFPQGMGEASDIRIAHCPERVLPGKVMHELITNDRIIGGMTLRCSREAALLYKIFVNGDCIIASSPQIAEMAKLAENSFRDVNIAFANELSVICDHLNIDVWELIQLANRHPRVNILQPGPGVGGHCIAVDPWFIVASAPQTARLIRTAREVNDSIPDWVMGKVSDAVALLNIPDSQRPRLACFGLAFKPDVDDLRQSPALEIVRRLTTHGGFEIMVVEPHVYAAPTGLEDIELVDANIAFARADIVLLLVDHKDFRSLRPPTDTPVIDTRGLWRFGRRRSAEEAVPDLRTR